MLPVPSTETEEGRLRLSRQQRLELFLSHIGYDLCRIGLTGLLHPLSSIGVHSDLFLTHYPFAPRENAAQPARAQ